MKKFNHPNVMDLIGICWLKGTEASPASAAPSLVLPYIELGDLKTYLRKCRPNRSRESVSLTDSFKMPLLSNYLIIDYKFYNK